MHVRRRLLLISVIVLTFMTLALFLQRSIYAQENSNYERFTVILNGKAVLDNDYGRIWEQEPNKKSMSWRAANAYCYHLNILGSTNWRLPTIEELSHLIDIRESNPSLPSGHPFSNVNIGCYWVARTDDKWSAPASDDDEAPTNADLSVFREDEISTGEISIAINGGAFYYFNKDEEHCVWCVKEEDHL